MFVGINHCQMYAKCCLKSGMAKIYGCRTTCVGGDADDAVSVERCRNKLSVIHLACWHCLFVMRMKISNRFKT